MSEIWIAIGRIGEYSDAREWPARAFRSEARASAWAREATAHAAALAADEEFRDRVRYNTDPSDADMDALGKYDATLVYTIDSGPNAGKRAANASTFWGEGPEYTVCRCVMEDA